MRSIEVVLLLVTLVTLLPIAALMGAFCLAALGLDEENAAGESAPPRPLGPAERYLEAHRSAYEGITGSGPEHLTGLRGGYRVQLRWLDSEVGLRVSAASLRGMRIERSTGTGRTGDAGFDAAVPLAGDEVTIATRMTAASRRCLRDAVEHRGATLSDGVLGLRVSEPDDLEAVIVEALALAVACSDESRHDVRLAAIAVDDPEPEVRARCLALLWLHHGDSPERLTALGALMGRDVESPVSAVEEQALVESLTGPADEAVAAALVLGRAGHAASYPALRTCAVRLGKPSDPRRRAVEGASRQLRERLGAVSGQGGTLAVVEGVGQLSEAEGASALRRGAEAGKASPYS